LNGYLERVNFVMDRFAQKNSSMDDIHAIQFVSHSITVIKFYRIGSNHCRYLTVRVHSNNAITHKKTKVYNRIAN